ncbi:HAMP domain-containing sensor histidine kinase [Paenibacillus sp. FSL M8-0334]|uniref:histidine kinase n=2 Tax=Paenibacillus TaxID=44249 RepID=A0A268EDS4_9BACL|nr:sensor histidine kinase [Paenibacillus campinasensis]
MKDVPKYIVLLLMALMLVLDFKVYPAAAEPLHTHTAITDWQFIWDWPDDQPALDGLQNRTDWVHAAPGDAKPPKPEGVHSAWSRFTVPDLSWKQPALMLDRVEGQEVVVYLEHEPLYESRRNYGYTKHSILLPIQADSAGKNLYVWTSGRDETQGITSAVLVGDYEELRGNFIRKDMQDFILGSSFLFIAIVMLFCSFFLPRHTISTWLALSLVILSSGALMLTYSPFLYTFYEGYGAVWTTLFDLALFSVMPAVYFYFEKIYGPGPYKMIRYLRRFQLVYSGLCLLLLAANLCSGYALYDIYYWVSVKVLGVLLIIQFLVLIGITVLNISKRNKDAYIFTFGFGLLAILSLGDLLWFYISNEPYEFYWWKWGIIGLIASLIVILGRKIIRSHEQVLLYSKKLELFNNELQRSEKMEIISELAASVAHEVRNPLQVTRGFMQLLAQKSKQSDAEYLKMALNELDRATGIISDFLSFAKPETEQVNTLDVYEELKHVTSILQPLANLAGGSIHLDEPKELYISGSSSKLKQAMINIVKNSIEALDEEGVVRIWAYAEGSEVAIHIKDNGIGMSTAELSRLGEPYFTNKLKGTGLGLMVTFRIIEGMKGTIKFSSRKGSGTEAIIRFPAVPPNTELTGA